VFTEAIFHNILSFCRPIIVGRNVSYRRQERREFFMGKGKRIKQKRRKGFVEEFSERLTVNFQKQVRNSKIWDQMVAQFGEERAEELLREMKAEFKPGTMPHEKGNTTKDIS